MSARPSRIPVSVKAAICAVVFAGSTSSVVWLEGHRSGLLLPALVSAVAFFVLCRPYLRWRERSERTRI